VHVPDRDSVDVVGLVLCPGYRHICGLHRVADAITRERDIHGNPGPLAQHLQLQLLDGVSPLQVSRDQQRRVAL